MSAPAEDRDSPSREQLNRELKSACEAEDVTHVRQLLTTTILGSSDATAAFGPSLSVPVLRCLLEGGADADSIVTKRRPQSLEQLKLLAEFGYDVRSKGHLILQDFAHSRDTLDWMLDQGVDVNSSNHERMDTTIPGNRIPGKDFSVKVLNNVAARGDTELFDHLVSRGADPHRSLALHAVSRCKDSGKSRAMVDHLLDKHHMNIEADSRALRDLLFSRDHGTPLHCAVHYRNLTTLDHLLTRGADPKSAVKYAIGNILFESYLPALVPLLEAGADATSALASAWETKNVEAARVCLAHGADPTRVIEEQRARDVRVRARREPGWVDDFEEEEDSDSADDDEDRANMRAEMRVLLQSVESSREDNPAT